MKKKLFVVSDIHSFYTPLKKALDEKGFDPNNENHWLIACGDCYDRGDESEEVLHFLMSLERKVLVRCTAHTGEVNVLVLEDEFIEE